MNIKDASITWKIPGDLKTLESPRSEGVGGSKD